MPCLCQVISPCVIDLVFVVCSTLNMKARKQSKNFLASRKSNQSNTLSFPLRFYYVLSLSLSLSLCETHRLSYGMIDEIEDRSEVVKDLYEARQGSVTSFHVAT
ncbi:unnamed protein product [Musa textilis]